MAAAVKRFGSRLCGWAGLNRLFRLLNRRRVCVVRYHGVTRDEWSWAEGNCLQVKESEFRKQMFYLARHFKVVPLASISFPLAPYPKPRVVITFDDGYANNFTVAYPVLRELNLPATIFVTTAFIDKDWIFWYDRLFFGLKHSVPPSAYARVVDQFKKLSPRTIETEVDDYLRHHGVDPSNIPSEFVNAFRTLRSGEIREMAGSGLINFGSHTHRHELLTRITLTEAEETIRKSLTVLGSLPGRVPFFCYPNGWYRPEHMDLLKSLGFRGAVTTEDGFWSAHDNPYGIPRIGIGRETDLSAFAGYVSGSLLTIRRLLRFWR
ncbi:MAG: polysaccharide deacetylase family protein [Kiritimatiellia bacterium]